MKRAQLEHIIRAACTIADDDELIIIGSQSVLAQFPDAPEELVVSLEADVYPRHHPERAELIEGAILSCSREDARRMARGSSSDPLHLGAPPGLLCFAVASRAAARRRLVLAPPASPASCARFARQSAGGPCAEVPLSDEDPSRARRALARTRSGRSTREIASDAPWPRATVRGCLRPVSGSSAESSRWRVGGRCAGRRRRAP